MPKMGKILDFKIKPKVESETYRGYRYDLLYDPAVSKWKWTVHVPVPMTPTLPKHSQKKYDRKQDAQRIAKLWIDKQLDAKLPDGAA